MRSGRGHLFALLFLLVASSGTYFYALVDIPHRDHFHYMLERAFFESDWSWFWHSVSWTRTRMLWGGDSYLFRPLHMAVIALKDIFLRENLFAAGAINIVFMAVAGFSLYLFARRLLGWMTAVGISVLFMVQHAGIEMVSWGHINPYVIALALFGFSLTAILKADGDNPKMLPYAGVILLIGALFHEIIIVALIMTALVFVYIMLRSGSRAEIDGIPLRKYFFSVIALPVVVPLGLNLMDFLSKGAPHRFDPLIMKTSTLHYALLTASGAPVVAFLAPFTVNFVQGDTGVLRWDFSELMPLITWSGAILGISLLVGIFLCIRSLRKGNTSTLSVVTLIALFTYCAYITGVGYGRLHLRNIDYLYEATYYYSITAYIFCLLISIGLRRLFDRWGTRGLKNHISAVVLVAVIVLACINIYKTVNALKADWQERYESATLALEIGRVFSEHEEELCLAGFSPRAEHIDKELQGMLLRNRFCLPEDKRRRIYVVAGTGGSLWLADIVKHPIESAKGIRKATLEQKNGGFEILYCSYPLDELSKEMAFFISKDSYDRPDLSFTLKHALNTAIILGYQDPANFVAFRMDGPRIFVRRMKEGQLSTMLYRSAIPLMDDGYRIEVRHAGNYVYLFINENLITSMLTAFEKPGKVAVALQKSRVDETSVSDILVAPSEINAQPAFKPLVKLKN